MALFLSIAGIGTGLGITAYGHYKHAKADSELKEGIRKIQDAASKQTSQNSEENKRNEIETNKQITILKQKNAMEKQAASQWKGSGIAIVVAVAAGIIYIGQATQSTTPKPLPSFPIPEDTITANEDTEISNPQPQVAPIIPEIPVATQIVPTAILVSQENTDCPLEQLQNLLAKFGPDAPISKTFKILSDTQGISCDNYLPFQQRFYKDSPSHLIKKRLSNIRLDDMTKPIMWGIDSFDRPYSSVKHLHSSVSVDANGNGYGCFDDNDQPKDCDKPKECIVTISKQYIDTKNTKKRENDYFAEISNEADCPSAFHSHIMNPYEKPEQWDKLQSFFQGNSIDNTPTPWMNPKYLETGFPKHNTIKYTAVLSKK